MDSSVGCRSGLVRLRIDVARPSDRMKSSRPRPPYAADASAIAEASMLFSERSVSAPRPQQWSRLRSRRSPCSMRCSAPAPRRRRLNRHRLCRHRSKLSCSSVSSFRPTACSPDPPRSCSGRRPWSCPCRLLPSCPPPWPKQLPPDLLDASALALKLTAASAVMLRFVVAVAVSSTKPSASATPTAVDDPVPSPFAVVSLDPW